MVSLATVNFCCCRDSLPLPSSHFIGFMKGSDLDYLKIMPQNSSLYGTIMDPKITALKASLCVETKRVLKAPEYNTTLNGFSNKLAGCLHMYHSGMVIILLAMNLKCSKANAVKCEIFTHFNAKQVNFDIICHSLS